MRSTSSKQAVRKLLKLRFDIALQQLCCKLYTLFLKAGERADRSIYLGATHVLYKPHTMLLAACSSGYKDQTRADGPGWLSQSQKSTHYIILLIAGDTE